MIEKAFKGTRGYFLWLLILGLGTLLGILSYIKQLKVGLAITGMGRDVSWGLYISNFTFFVGVAASAVMLVIPYYLHKVKEYGKILVFAEFLAVTSVLMAILFVFVDLGRPDRVMNMILHPTPNSLLFWDVVVLSGYLILNVIMAWKALEAERNGLEPPSWVRPLVYLSIPWAISIHTVTAFIYSGVLARPFWLTPLLAPRFLASAFTSGPSMLLLILLILERLRVITIDDQVVSNLKKTVTYALSVHVFFLIAELFTVFYGANPEHEEPYRYLILGIEEGSYQSFLFILSSLLSLATLILLITGKSGIAVLIAVVFSIWVEKGIVLVTTGFVPNPENIIPRYVPTLPETLITLGIWSLGAIICTLLFKIAIDIKGGGKP